MRTSVISPSPCFGPASAAGKILGPPQFSVTIPAAPLPTEKPRGAVLVGEAARVLVLNSCLHAPRNNLQTWVPSSPDIATIEKALPPFMSKQVTPDDYRPLHEYYRQYAGFFNGGRRLVCLNLFHYSHLVSILQLASRDPVLYNKLRASGPVEDYWRREAIFVDDGGALYFSLEYDVELGGFAFLQFNGYA